MKEEEQWLIDTFENCVNQEKLWAEYLFKDGSMIGLNDKLLQQYVEWIANRRMKAIGLKPIYDIPAKNNPLPWTEHWISSKVFKWLRRKLKLNPTSSEESNKMLPKTHSQDLVSDSMAAYREAAKSDSFLFGDYDGYKAFEELEDQ